MTSTVSAPPSGATAAVPSAMKVTVFNPWRGPAPDPDAHPQQAAALQATSARSIGALFMLVILLQRFAVPGVPDASLLVAVVVVWCVWMLIKGVMEVNRTRLYLWLLSAGLAGILVPIQHTFVPESSISLPSYLLMFVVWWPATLQFKDRRRATFLRAARAIAHGAAFLAALCVIFMISQLAGLPYQDYMADIFPKDLLLQDFVITYPIAYESPIYRANGWIGLEPSMVSIMMGVGLLAGFFSMVRLRILALIALGMLCSTAGSGLAILLVALVVILAYPVRRDLEKYLPIAIPALLVVLATPYGQAILSRATESGTEQSSTGLRGIMPYAYVWPQWISDPVAMIVGRGPGSSQVAIDNAKVLGLLVPSPVKLFFEYGLMCGLVMFCLLLYSYFGGPSRSLAVGLAVSFWFLQPGTTTMVIVVHVFLVTTWWSPRCDRVLESDASTLASARRLVERVQRWHPATAMQRWQRNRHRTSTHPVE